MESKDLLLSFNDLPENPDLERFNFTVTMIFTTTISKSCKTTIACKMTKILGSDRIFIVAIIFLAMISKQ